MPALMTNNVIDVRYLTGLRVSQAVVLASSRSYQMFVDQRYTEEARLNVRAGVVVRDVRMLERALATVPICAFDENEVTVGILSKWKSKNKNTKFIRTCGILAEFRRTKDREELRLIDRAYRITREILRRVPHSLRVGITEKALAWKLRVWAQELGADDLSFDPIVAFASHTSRPHHHPTARALKKGHIVQVDVGAQFRGYCADLAQVYFTSAQTDEQKAMYNAIIDAWKTAKKICVPGAVNTQIDARVRDILKRHGFPQGYPHALGHGVGLEVHEGVTLSKARKPRALLKDEVVAVEPGLYIPGKYGMRIEDMIVV